MDFVQLKDQRGACFEPMNSLSGYRWNGGIGYYVEIEDASTNFFFDSLSKGVYVLEYSYRVARSGQYEAEAGNNSMCLCSRVCSSFSISEGRGGVEILKLAFRNSHLKHLLLCILK